MSASLGTLVVQLAADTVKFEGDLGKAADAAERHMKNIKDTASRFLGAVVVEAAAAGAALLEIFKKGVERSDELNNLAEASGVAVESLSRLQFAAQGAGIPIEALGIGLRTLSVNISQAAGGNKEAQRKFEALGISIYDVTGNLKAADSVFKELAAKFSSYADGSAKTADAVALLGRSGSDLIPILNKGADGLDELGKKSDELGATLDKKTVAAVEQFKEKINELKGLSEGFSTHLAAALAPALTKLASAFLDSKNAAANLDTVVRIAAEGLKIIFTAATALVGVFKTLGDLWGAQIAFWDEIIHGRFKEAWATLKDGAGDVVSNIKKTIGSISDIWSDEGAKVESSAPDTGKKLAAPIIAATGYIATWADKIKGLYEEIRIETGKHLDEETKKIYEETAKQLEKLPAIAEPAFFKMLDIADEGARGMQAAFADFLFDPAKKGLDGLVQDFINAFKRILAEAAALKIFNSIFGRDKTTGESGLGGTIGNFLGSLFGFASGGSFDVGGSGGTDSQVVAFRATPGERVSVTNPGQGGGGAFIINNNIDARGASADALQLLPSILRANNEAMKRDIFDQLSRRGGR